MSNEDIKTQVEEKMYAVWDKELLPSQAYEEILSLINEAKASEFEKMVKMIDDFKPDPAAPSFGSASGGIERSGWRSYFVERIEDLKREGGLDG